MWTSKNTLAKQGTDLSSSHFLKVKFVKLLWRNRQCCCSNSLLSSMKAHSVLLKICRNFNQSRVSKF